MTSKAAAAGTLVIMLHVIVTLVHDEAHKNLGVKLNLLQNLYAYTVIVGAPLVALVMLWTRLIRQAGLLLAFSMAGSFAFATFFHYIHISPDHVNHLPDGDAQGLFRFTALLMIPAEILGIVTGLAIWRKAGPAKKSAHENPVSS